MAAPMITAWSYSRYGVYAQCPLKFKLKFIDKLPEPGSPAMERGNVIHKQAEDYVREAGAKPPPVPADLKNVATELEFLRTNGATVEQEWGFNRTWDWTGRQGWFGNDVWFRMKADVVLAYDDGTGLVGDWKTGKMYFSNEEQVELFGAVAMRRYSWDSVDVRLWYTDAPASDNEIQREFTAAEGEKILAGWEKRVRPMFNDRKFPPKPNQWCSRCAYGKGNGGPCKF